MTDGRPPAGPEFERGHRTAYGLAGCVWTREVGYTEVESVWVQTR